MQRKIDIEIKKLTYQVLEMGKKVEQSIDLAVKGLMDRNPACFDEVMVIERRVNQYHMDIDNACLKLLATQAPLANNLRYVLASIKINGDLERMGDQAVNIADNAKFYLNESLDLVKEDLIQMSEEARVMLHQALDAYAERSVAKARDVIEKDKSVDDLKDKIFKDLIRFMEGDSKAVSQSLDLILIARNVERIGDHATNIAEDVVFACTGEDLRHSRTTASVVSG